MPNQRQSPAERIIQKKEKAKEYIKYGASYAKKVNHCIHYFSTF